MSILSAHMVLGEVLRLGSEVTAWFEEFVSGMYLASQRQMQSNRDVHAMLALPTHSLTSNLPLTDPSPPAMENAFEPLEFPNTIPLLTTHNMDHERDQTYKSHSPGISLMDSDTFPFEIFSELDQVRKARQITSYHPDHINDDNEMFNIFQA